MAERNTCLTASAHPLSTSDAEGVSERAALFERETRKEKNPSGLSERQIISLSNVNSLFILSGQS
jgi:hypothetical protein